MEKEKKEAEEEERLKAEEQKVKLRKLYISFNLQSNVVSFFIGPRTQKCLCWALVFEGFVLVFWDLYWYA